MAKRRRRSFSHVALFVISGNVNKVYAVAGRKNIIRLVCVTA